MRDSDESRLDEAAQDTVPLVPGLLCFALISVLGNQLDLYLRYPEVGAAVLFPPYAALTGFLVLSRPGPGSGTSSWRWSPTWRPTGRDGLSRGCSARTWLTWRGRSWPPVFS